MRLPRIAVSVAAASAALLGAAEAAADTGPTYAIGHWFSSRDELAIITGGVLVLTDVTTTTVTITDALAGRDSGRGLYLVEAIAVAPQSLAFAGSPFVYDISSWDAVDNLLLLIPSQAWTGAIGTHGIWSLLGRSLPPAPRLGVSALIGTNWAFSVTALGCGKWGKAAPLDVGVAELVYGGAELAFTFERVAHDPEHRTEWGLLAGWSAILTAHGVGSTVISARKNSSSSVAEPDLDRTGFNASPYVAPVDGGAVVGVGGIID